MREVGLIVKATRLCNLRCTYCHEWRAGPGNTMSFEVLANMTAKVLSDPEHDSVNFIWHGGEPTMLSMDFYRRALAIQARFERPGQRVHNTLQTNGTRINDDWARFFSRYGFRVGVSLDGAPEVHDSQRLFANGKPTFDEVIAGHRILVEHGIADGILMVVDEPTLALGATHLAQVIDGLGVTHIGLLAARPENQPDAEPGTPATPTYVTPGRMAHFTGDLDDELRRMGSQVAIRDVEAVRTLLADDNPRLCLFQGDCFGRFYLIEPNGDVAHCDLFDPDPDYDFGNVLTHTFADIRASEKMQRLQREREASLEAMRSCPEFGVCNGWCPHEEYTARRHDPEYDPGCCGLRSLIERLRDSTDGPPPKRRIPVTAV